MNKMKTDTLIKHQNSEKKRNLVTYGMQITLIVCCIFSGASALGDTGYLSEQALGILMLFSFALTILLYLTKKEIKEINTSRTKKSTTISIFTFICSIIFTGSVIAIFSDGYVPPGIELSSVGPTVNLILTLSFTISLLLLGMQLFRYNRTDDSAQLGGLVSVATMYLISLYGNLFHKINTFQGVVNEFAIITVAVTCCTAISLIVTRISKKKNNLHTEGL